MLRKEDGNDKDDELIDVDDSKATPVDNKENVVGSDSGSMTSRNESNLIKDSPRSRRPGCFTASSPPDSERRKRRYG